VYTAEHGVTEKKTNRISYIVYIPGTKTTTETT